MVCPTYTLLNNINTCSLQWFCIKAAVFHVYNIMFPAKDGKAFNLDEGLNVDRFARWTNIQK